MTKLNRTNRKDVTLAAALWLALMGLLLLSAAPNAAVDKDSLEVMDELRRLEDAYSNASLKTRKLAKSDFVSLLITNLEHPSRSVRRRATYLTNVYFADDPQVLARLVDLLEPDRFAELPVQARINAMHLVAGAGEKAWAPELLERATERIRQIGAVPPDGWAAQQEEYYATLRKRIVDLAELPSSTWAFGTVQERGAETKGLTDVDVFVCEDSREDIKIVDQARRLASLVAEREFGRVRLRVWSSDKGTPLDELKPHSTIFFDEKHPEEKEVRRVEKAFAEVEGLPACRALPNSGRPSPWYLSIVICPSRPEDITPEEIQTPLRLIGLTAVNPQSNWPKNCDEIYLKINRTRIWEQPQEICRGDRIELDIPLEEGSTIELWEHDASGDDNLGTIATKPSICRLPAVVEGKTAIGDWRYVFEFAQ